MTGPYERQLEVNDLAMVSGRIELQHDGARIVVTVHAGEATLTLVEQWDEQVVAFGNPEPVRRVGGRHKLRLLVEADLDQMYITTRTEPAGPG